MKEDHKPIQAWLAVLPYKGSIFRSYLHSSQARIYRTKREVLEVYPEAKAVKITITPNK